MNITTVNDSIYILELAPPYERVTFQFMPPSFEWDRVGNWVSFPIVGRNNSKKHLTGGEDRITLTLDFNSLFEDNKKDAIDKMYWLQSLTANNGSVGKARNVSLQWGSSDIFRHKVWIVKRVKSIASEFSGKFGYVPTQMSLQITLEIDSDENTLINDIRAFSFPILGSQGNDFSGIA